MLSNKNVMISKKTLYKALINNQWFEWSCTRFSSDKNFILSVTTQISQPRTRDKKDNSKYKYTSYQIKWNELSKKRNEEWRNKQERKGKRLSITDNFIILIVLI